MSDRPEGSRQAQRSDNGDTSNQRSNENGSGSGRPQLPPPGFQLLPTRASRDQGSGSGTRAAAEDQGSENETDGRRQAMGLARASALHQNLWMADEGSRNLAPFAPFQRPRIPTPPQPLPPSGPAHHAVPPSNAIPDATMEKMIIARCGRLNRDGIQIPPPLPPFIPGDGIPQDPSQRIQAQGPSADGSNLQMVSQNQQRGRQDPESSRQPVPQVRNEGNGLELQQMQPAPFGHVPQNVQQLQHLQQQQQQFFNAMQMAMRQPVGPLPDGAVVPMMPAWPPVARPPEFIEMMARLRDQQQFLQSQFEISQHFARTLYAQAMGPANQMARMTALQQQHQMNLQWQQRNQFQEQQVQQLPQQQEPQQQRQQRPKKRKSEEGVNRVRHAEQSQSEQAPGNLTASNGQMGNPTNQDPSEVSRKIEKPAVPDEQQENQVPGDKKKKNND